MTSEGSPALGDLARALLTASRTPALLLGLDGDVRMASDSFCRAFGLDPADIVDHPLATLKHWALPALDGLLQSVRSGRATDGDCEVTLAHPDRTPQMLAINVQRIDDPTNAGGALLVTVADVQAHGRPHAEVDALLREKDMLMQELQHRTSNSLQIIASVLKHGARQTSSAEARAHLLDGYHRILAVATVQQQLAITCRGEVDLQPYLSELCDSIRDSLIGAPAPVALEVEIADCRVDADVAGSLGLLVTELVINALKHAFPGNATGVITVSYRNDGAAWRLSVRDTGVGMAQRRASANAGTGVGMGVGGEASKGGGVSSGLGSNIVRATAHKLAADVRTTRMSPGTEVAIVHG